MCDVDSNLKIQWLRPASYKSVCDLELSTFLVRYTSRCCELCAHAHWGRSCGLALLRRVLSGECWLQVGGGEHTVCDVGSRQLVLL